MSKNKELYKQSLDEINLETFKEAIFLAYRDGITTTAPLGFSGDDVVLYGTHQSDPWRTSVITIRNHSHDAKLLITDTKGNFLFYGGFDINLGVEFIAQKYLEIFEELKPHIETEIKELSQFKLKFSKDMKLSEGFKMLKVFQKNEAIKMKIVGNQIKIIKNPTLWQKMKNTAKQMIQK